MPYKKRKKNPSTKAMIYKQVQQQIRRAAEKKYYDEATAITGLDINGSINAIWEPTQGVQNDELVGNKALITSVEVAITLFSPGLATTNPYNQTRITLVTWKGQNVPTLLDIYQVNSLDYMVLSPFARPTSKLRKVHFDQVYDQYYVGANNFAENPLKTIKFVIPMIDKKGINEIWFDPVGYTNQLYLIIVANNNGNANTKWDAKVHTRVNYLDM